MHVKSNYSTCDVIRRASRRSDTLEANHIARILVSKAHSTVPDTNVLAHCYHETPSRIRQFSTIMDCTGVISPKTTPPDPLHFTDHNQETFPSRTQPPNIGNGPKYKIQNTTTTPRLFFVREFAKSPPPSYRIPLLHPIARRRGEVEAETLSASLSEVSFIKVPVSSINTAAKQVLLSLLIRTGDVLVVVVRPEPRSPRQKRTLCVRALRLLQEKKKKRGPNIGSEKTGVVVIESNQNKSIHSGVAKFKKRKGWTVGSIP